jgi:hypothetical protein
MNMNDDENMRAKGTSKAGAPLTLRFAQGDEATLRYSQG